MGHLPLLDQKEKYGVGVPQMLTGTKVKVAFVPDSNKGEPMKKTILSLLAVFTAMGLNAGETTVEKLHDHYSAEANKTDNPMVQEMAKGITDATAKRETQKYKNLKEAIERLSNGNASEADKELIKSVDEPSLKKLQNVTAYPFKIDINSPVYHTLAMGGEMVPTVIAVAIDLYTIKHCTNDLSKMTFEDIQNAGSSKEYFSLITLGYKAFGSTKNDYVKFVHAARAFNCADSDILKKYLQKDNEFEGTFLTGLVKDDMGDKPVLMSYKNEVGNECTVIGHTSPTIPSLGGQYAKTEIKLEKETCKSGEAFKITGYVTMPDGNMIFSNILPGDKVKIVKTK